MQVLTVPAPWMPCWQLRQALASSKTFGPAWERQASSAAAVACLLRLGRVQAEQTMVETMHPETMHPKMEAWTALYSKELCS